MTESTGFKPGAHIAIATLPNLRDVGGYLTAKGHRVRTGRLYRSVEAGKLDGDDVELFGQLGVRTIFDLRTRAEVDKSPDQAPGARGVHLDVIADSTGAASARLLQLIDDPAGATEAMGGGGVKEIYAEAYREFIELDSANRSYSALFTDLAETETLPGLVHCTAGKDRTGWAVAALLLFLGVSERDVLFDYLLTNEQLLPSLIPTFDAFADAGGDPELMKSVFSVKPEYLKLSLGLAVERYGTIGGYFSEGLGLDDSTLQALQDQLVEPAG
ncbi:MAG: tyrosine-protein phosphatase [Solirubrobacterales bacterium]